MSFWGELKRRNVFKVGAAYLIAAWLILQVASITFPALNLPDWALTLVTVLLIIGFIVALILAWAYEVTPDGVKLTKKVSLADSITHVTGRKLNYILSGLLVVAVGYNIVLQFLISKPPVQTEMTSTMTEQTPIAIETMEVKDSPKTIAVLPFDDLSPEKDQEYFVLGLSEEILNSLCQIPNLGVTGRTSSFAFKGTGKTIQEIAEILGVDNILEGSVRKAGDDLRITAQLVRASDSLHLWSKTYDRKFEDIFAVQEDIAATVADELKATLGIERSVRQIGGTINKEAYELYLVAKGQIRSAATYEDWKRFSDSIEQVIPIDPEFALAWDLKSKAHIQLSLYGPASQISAERDAAFQAARRAIELEPKLGSTYIKLGFLEMSKGHWSDAESHFRRALELSHQSLTGDDDYVVAFYNSVGNFKRADELIELIRQYDPFHIGYRGHEMYNLAYRGKIQQAENEYKLCKATFGDVVWHNRVISLIRLGSGEVVSPNDIVFSDPALDIARKYSESPEEGLSELHRLVDLNVETIGSIWACAAYFNDPEFAIDEIERFGSIHPEGLFNVWLPVMHEARQLPRFKKFVRDIGLVDYWEQYGWPDLCVPTGDGDFVCD